MKTRTKKFLTFLLVLVLVLCISVPCFAITPSYSEPSGYTFIESSMHKILVNRHNYNLAPNATKTFDNQFSYAFYPYSDTVAEFDAIIDNASIFIGGITNGIMSGVTKAYRFITFNPLTNTTNYILYIAKCSAFTEATFSLEPRAALNGLYYRLKQNNTNSSAAGDAPCFTYVCVSFPRSWTGGTTGVTYKSYHVSNNSFSEDRYCSFSHSNLLWADSNMLSILGSVQDSWKNYYTNQHFVAGSHIQNVNLTRPLDVNQTNWLIAAGCDSSRLTTDGQYYLDFEFYYDGFNVSDDFLVNLFTYQNPIRFSDSTLGSVISYELLSSTSNVISSSGYVLRLVKFRAWFQPSNLSLSSYDFQITWYSSIEWGTPLTGNNCTFLLDLPATDDNTLITDITHMWNELSGSLDFFRYTVNQIFLCFPSDIYYLTVIVIYLTILLSGIRLIL